MHGLVSKLMKPFRQSCGYRVRACGQASKARRGSSAHNTSATIRTLIRAARDDLPQVRAVAVKALPVYSNFAARNAARLAFTDRDPGVQKAAMFAFMPQWHGDRAGSTLKYDAATWIIPLLKKDETRGGAQVLGNLGMNVRRSRFSMRRASMNNRRSACYHRIVGANRRPRYNRSPSHDF